MNYDANQIREMWPQASAELRGFANALERSKSGLTAAQLRMAIQLADEAYKVRTEPEYLELSRLAQMMTEGNREGWSYSADVNDVPATCGHYTFQDGLRSDSGGGGVTHNMRRSVEIALSSHRNFKRPIFGWLPDTDGSAALYLEGRGICNRCDHKPEMTLDELDEHGIKFHGDKRWDDHS